MMTSYLRLFAGLTSFMRKRWLSHLLRMSPPGTLPSSFRFLFTQVGLTGADMGAGYLLPKVVGLSKATEMLMLGDKVDADTAYRFGLANKVVADEEVVDAAMEWARRGVS